MQKKGKKGKDIEEDDDDALLAAAIAENEAITVRSKQGLPHVTWHASEESLSPAQVVSSRLVVQGPKATKEKKKVRVGRVGRVVRMWKGRHQHGLWVKYVWMRALWCAVTAVARAQSGGHISG